MSSETAKSVPHHGLITVSLILATTMQGLDGTIANVALPSIQASMAATQEQMSWVLTSYIVATAIMIPLSGWLSSRIGRKKVLLASIMAFTLTSMLCGLAQSLPQLVFFRLLQGLSGAALVPMSQATLLDINPPERHARAMSMFVMGVTIGPIMGPLLGGWLTAQYSWRWVFFINVPIGAACFSGLFSYMPETQTRRSSFDYFGFATLTVAILALQLMLDRGQLKDWFNSTEIWVELVFASIAAYWFAIHSATAREPFIDLRLFKDRNFVLGSIFILVIGVLMFAPMALLPSLLQDLMNYPVITAGRLMAPRGLGTVAATLALKPLLRILDTRAVIGTGFAVTSIAIWSMSGFYLQMNGSLLVWSGVLLGFGVGLSFVPLATAAFATLPGKMRNEGTSVFSLMRNLGSSIGIAVVQVLFIRNIQIMHARLVEHVTPFRNPLHELPDLTSTSGLLALNGQVTQQATMMAYNNVFKLMFFMSIACVPLVLLLRKATTAPGVVVVAE
jgi:MFS transporter, DHA2 family, multidrug resistance protein